MEFRLTYDGVLLGASRSDTRSKHKQEIREQFHPQLKAFWEKHPFLNSLRRNEHLSSSESRAAGYREGLTGVKHVQGRPWLEKHADSFERSGIRFAPLVSQEMEMLCSLDILFLRPESPGALINAGDLDNRLKTLFDALRMPASKEELAGFSTAPEFEPFFVLLEDDKLITGVAIETDLLLAPSFKSPNECRLVIKVNAQPYAPTHYSRKMDRSFWS